MSWNHRLALWLCHLLAPGIGKHNPPPPCPDFLDPDDEWSQWAEYISKPHVTESNRHYLEALWTKK
jgi:hypothetical protein